MDQALILKNLSTAVLSLDHELKLCFINHAAESLLGVSGTKGIGQRLTELVPGFVVVEATLFEAIQTNQPFTQRQAQLLSANQQPITIDYTVTPVSDGEWPRLLLEFHAIDRYLRIDRDAALREHQQVTQQMLRGLAHEIKNPLGGIRGAAQLLATELSSPDLDEYTQIIIEETDRLAGLVDRLLGPNTLPKFSPSNIHEVLEKVRRLIEVEADHAILVTRDYDPSIPEFEMDSDMMMQAVLNIARNAMQSMSNTEGPTLTFITRTERQFTINSERHRLVLRIDIIDNGPGIPDELKENLFYPMISGRPDGTGLGLSVAHSIIHRHKGIIEVDSIPGWTQFTMILPLEASHGND